MTEDEIDAKRARDAMLDQMKRLRPHGLRLTPQNLVVAAELVRFNQAEAYECEARSLGSDVQAAFVMTLPRTASAAWNHGCR
jgi:hypothetical protein